MKLTPYNQVLIMGKEALDKALASRRANAVKKQGELEQAKLEERIASLENEINVMTSQRDINFDMLINKLDELGLAERKREQFNDILGQMFPTETQTPIEGNK